jgi:hypothetical protein
MPPVENPGSFHGLALMNLSFSFVWTSAQMRSLTDARENASALENRRYGRMSETSQTSSGRSDEISGRGYLNQEVKRKSEVF